MRRARKRWGLGNRICSVLAVIATTANASCHQQKLEDMGVRSLIVLPEPFYW